MAKFSQVSGSLCNENATRNETYGVLKKGWRCRNSRKAPAGFRSRPGFLGRDRAILVLCRDKGSLSRHGSQVLSYRKCRNMAFLCCDRVTGSVS